MGIRTPGKLPVYRGITVDIRLRQFRYIRKDGDIEFIEFDSDRGDAILARAIRAGFFNDDELNNLF